MAKDPAFLFYSQDFAVGTQFFSDEQTGKYMRLLIAQHQHGHLHEEHMIKICERYDKHIFSKFIKDSNGLYYNERLEVEIIKRKNYAETRRKNRLGTKNEKTTYVPHMENENTIIVFNNIKEFENHFLKDQIWAEQTCMGFSIDIPELKIQLGEFYKDQFSKKKLNRTVSELRDHFINRTRGILQEKRASPSKGPTTFDYRNYLD